jgi:hypothetical protein
MVITVILLLASDVVSISYAIASDVVASDVVAEWWRAYDVSIIFHRSCVTAIVLSLLLLLIIIYMYTFVLPSGRRNS